jgi:hypothetical protein
VCAAGTKLTVVLGTVVMIMSAPKSVAAVVASVTKRRMAAAVAEPQGYATIPGVGMVEPVPVAAKEYDEL